jgi:hypothetical protein
MPGRRVTWWMVTRVFEEVTERIGGGRLVA